MGITIPDFDTSDVLYVSLPFPFPPTRTGTNTPKAIWDRKNPHRPLRNLPPPPHPPRHIPNRYFRPPPLLLPSLPRRLRPDLLPLQPPRPSPPLGEGAPLYGSRERAFSAVFEEGGPIGERGARDVRGLG